MRLLIVRLASYLSFFVYSFRLKERDKLLLHSWGPSDFQLGGDFLRLVPKKNANLLWENTPTGKVSVMMKQKTSFTLLLLRPKKIIFDETGSYVLGLMDGQRTGLEIARILSETRSLNLEQAETSVRDFLRTLQRREIITLREREKTERFCNACGAKLPYDAQYCPLCGVKQTSNEP